jgi:hypothetical protein
MRAYLLLADRGMDFAPLPSHSGTGFTQKTGDENATLCEFGLLFGE